MSVPALALCFCVGIGTGSAGDLRTSVLNTFKTRPLAMGGAFASVEDDLSALDFNPAAYRLGEGPEEIRVHAFLNPAGPVLLLANASRIDSWIPALSGVVQGVGCALGRFHGGIAFAGEMPAVRDRSKSPGFFDATDFGRDSNTDFGFSFHLAPKVSLGAAGEMAVREGAWRRARFGYRYGLLLRPRADLSFGMCYFDSPKGNAADRVPLERLADATLNIGAAYAPAGWLRLALDVRNVSDEGKEVVREPHVGLEIVPFRHLALESGYFRIRGDGGETFSAGLCLLDQHAWIRPDRPHAGPRWVLRSALVESRGPAGRSRWVFLTGTLSL
ncbi:MAG: hypothetical protein QUS35_13030 [bacterium]|nr:hypothetical protein [bacterium]